MLELSPHELKELREMGALDILQRTDIVQRIVLYLKNMYVIHKIPPDKSLLALLELGRRHEKELIKIAKGQGHGREGKGVRGEETREQGN